MLDQHDGVAIHLDDGVVFAVADHVAQDAQHSVHVQVLQVQHDDAAILLHGDAVLHGQRLHLRALNLVAKDIAEGLLTVGVGQLHAGHHVDQLGAQHGTAAHVRRVARQAQKQRLIALRADQGETAVNERLRGIIPQHLRQREFTIVALGQHNLAVIVQQHDGHIDLRQHLRNLRNDPMIEIHE